MQDRNKKIKIAAAVAIITTAAVVYIMFDPSQSHWMPKCLFLSLTGYKCPGCGSQRLMHALLTGHPIEAFRYNPFVMLMLPVIAAMLWLELNRKRRPRLYAKVYRPGTVIIFAVVTIIWTVIRNL